MARLFSLFGDRKVQEEAVPAPLGVARAAPPVSRPRPESGIQFDSDLIQHLVSDHSHLLSQFTALLPLLRSGDSKSFKTRLQAFKTEFQGHIIKENVKFYVYLEQALSSDETNLELMRDFRREMNSISRAVVHFCNRFIDDSLSESAIARFAKESNEIGEALLRRIEREERDLYPLYACR